MSRSTAGPDRRIEFGDEGDRVLRERERSIFPWPVRTNVTWLLWSVVGVLCAALAAVILAGRGALG